MLVEIGLIVGLYVMTRMVDILCRPKEQRNAFMVCCALFTLMMTGLLTFALLVQGMTPTSNVPRGWS